MQLQLVNTGDSIYRDSPANGTRLIDTQKQQHDASIVPTAGGPDIGSPTIDVGDTRLGWITVQVPQDVVAERFTLALDSGFTEQTGDWLLTSGTPTDPAPAAVLPDSEPGDAITLKGLDGELVAPRLLWRPLAGR